tara:strand:+ start:497 stop:1321 length:825 start_codon:yes stop_codon:yes gene_type:complete
MPHLSSNEIKQYKEKGYVAPIDILNLEEINKVREEIEFIEKKWPNEFKGLGRYNFHYLSPIFDKVVHNSKILDAVEDIIGQDILVAGTTLFIKEPDKKAFVSWHQDAKYIGFDSNNFVTAWLAITESNQENGCMWMWQGSHNKLREHKDQFEENNLLTRGQTVENVPKNETVPIELKPGQLSLHHPMVVHASAPNNGNSRRIGFVIQSYIGSNVKQLNGKVYVQQARGGDTFKYHEHTDRPSKLMNKETIEWRNKANKELQDVLYKGAIRVRDV